jgi:hypothetical protein
VALECVRGGGGVIPGKGLAGCKSRCWVCTYTRQHACGLSLYRHCPAPPLPPKTHTLVHRTCPQVLGEEVPPGVGMAAALNSGSITLVSGAAQLTRNNLAPPPPKTPTPVLHPCPTRLRHPPPTSNPPPPPSYTTITGAGGGGSTRCRHGSCPQQRQHHPRVWGCSVAGCHDGGATHNAAGGTVRPQHGHCVRNDSSSCAGEKGRCWGGGVGGWAGIGSFMCRFLDTGLCMQL